MKDDWCAEAALQKIISRAFNVAHANLPQPVHEIQADREVSVNELKDSLVKAACLVERYGDEYLDYFLRIQDELEITEAKQNALEEARKLASNSPLNQSNPVQP